MYKNLISVWILLQGGFAVDQRPTDMSHGQVESRVQLWLAQTDDSPCQEKLTKLKLAAEEGNSNAQYALARKYFEGIGVSKDFHEAMKWSHRSALQDHILAQFLLGVIYHAGKGGEVDYAQASWWYLKAAHKGYAPAQYNLALLYDAGLGVLLDVHKAMQWYKKAAVQGHKFAQYNLACNYRRGIGGEANQEQAVRWYHLSAIQGYAGAQYEIGCAYQTGLCLKKDNKKAREWFQLAAAQSHARALYELGCLYKNGDGVQADPVQAISYFLRAARLQQGGAGDSAKQALLCYFNFACLWNGKQGVPFFPNDQWDELQLNLQNLKDVYPALEAYAGSGLGWGTVNQNPCLQTLSHKIFSLITQYEKLINNLKTKMIREPGFLINCVHFSCPQLKTSFKQLGLYVRLDKDLPSYLDLSFSYEEMALLLKLMQSHELPQLISTLKHFYLSARNVLQELAKKEINAQQLPFLLEGIFLVLKASDSSDQTEDDLYSFLVAFLQPYMASHGKMEQIHALQQAIKGLEQHLADLDNHVEFAQSLNQEIIKLIRGSQPYRNHFFRVNVLSNTVYRKL